MIAQGTVFVLRSASWSPLHWSRCEIYSQEQNDNCPWLGKQMDAILQLHNFSPPQPILDCCRLRVFDLPHLSSCFFLSIRCFVCVLKSPACISFVRVLILLIWYFLLSCCPGNLKSFVCRVISIRESYQKNPAKRKKYKELKKIQYPNFGIFWEN